MTLPVKLYLFTNYYLLFQFSDKLEGLLETMATTAEQVDRAEPISAHPDKLKDQISDNKAIIEDLEKRMAALEAVKATADDLIHQPGMDEEHARGGLLT